MAVCSIRGSSKPDVPDGPDTRDRLPDTTFQNFGGLAHWQVLHPTKLTGEGHQVGVCPYYITVFLHNL